MAFSNQDCRDLEEAKFLMGIPSMNRITRGIFISTLFGGVRQ